MNCCNHTRVCTEGLTAGPYRAGGGAPRNARWRLFAALTTPGLLTLFVVAVLAVGARAAVLELSTSQQTQVLQEAQTAFDRGVQAVVDRSPDAKALFGQAADKYRLLVGQGVRNSKLYFNLGNACLHSGQLGSAIANYQRALRLDPGDRHVAANLAFARSKLDPAAAGNPAWWQAILDWNRIVTVGGRLWIGVGAWCVLWLGLAAAFYVNRSWLRYTVVSAAVVVVLCASSVGLDWVGPGGEDRGVVVTGDAYIRNGGGDGFALKYERGLAEGTPFRLIEQRGGWLRVRLDDGRTGWIAADQAELVFANPWHDPSA